MWKLFLFLHIKYEVVKDCIVESSVFVCASSIDRSKLKSIYKNMKILVFLIRYYKISIP